MIEQWKTAPGFPDYEVSNIGRVRRATPGVNATVGHIRQATLDKNGYCVILLQRPNDKPKIGKVHRLVVLAFIGDIPEGMHVNHRNGIKSDNRIENLEIVSPSENTLHGFRVLGRKVAGGKSPGEAHGNAVLTDDLVRHIRKSYESGESQEKIAKRLHHSQSNVSRIIRRTAWSHVT